MKRILQWIWSQSWLTKGIIAAVLISFGLGVVGYMRGCGVSRQSARHDADTERRLKRAAEIEAENNRLRGENDALRREITDIKAQRAAQEQIIEQRGGEIAEQQQRIEQAQKEFEREEANSDQPMDVHARCERLKSIYIELRIRGADRIDCSAITR